METPPDPGLEHSVRAADAIVEVEILAGGPFRAIAQTRKLHKGQTPNVFELAGYNSYNWDTVHNGFATGGRCILFLSGTGAPDIFAPLTPSAPRLSVEPEGVMVPLGDPPFRVPVKKRALEEGLALLLELNSSGKTPERAAAFLQALWDEGEIEARYLAVAFAGTLRDARAIPLLVEASKDKLLKLRLTSMDALGKIGSPQAVAALRALLKDEKPTVAREAARILVSCGDGAALPDLLEWVRRFAPKAIGRAATGASAADADKSKTEQVALDVLVSALIAGPLLDRPALCRAALEIARSPSEALARAALQVVVELGDAAEVRALLELAEDRTYDWNTQAAGALQRLAIKWVKDAAEFRRWWAAQGPAFGEDLKRDLVESYAQGVATAEDADERRALLDQLRVAPGEMALVSAAPLLMKSGTSKYFAAEDFDAWRTALAVPFLIDRLAHESSFERRAALQGLARLCARQPRLKAAIWPLIRAELADSDSTSRRIAQFAGGLLQQADAVPAVVDSAQYWTGFESSDAGKAFYQLTARTLGFATNEPVPDQDAARKRVRGWWEAAQKDFRVVPRALSTGHLFGSELEPAARAAKLEQFLLDSDTRLSATAFALLHGERAASDPLWQRLLTQTRTRDKAHGILGLLGGDETLAATLAPCAAGEGGISNAPLCRALSVLVLASLKGSAGPDRLVEWMRAAGERIEPQWQRLGVLALGLSDRHAGSLAYLKELVAQSLASKSPLEDFFGEKSEPPLLRPALVALCARGDSSEVLVSILEKCADARLREHAARALSLRRCRAAVPGLLKAIDQSDRSDWFDLCRLVNPLLHSADVPQVRALLDSTNRSCRSAAAYLFAQRPDFGNDPETCSHLQVGLDDTSSIVRYYCTDALGKREWSAAAKKLAALLSDDDEEVRAGAAEALGRLRDPRGCAEATLAAEKETRVDARWLRALAIAGTDEALKTIFKLCNSTAYADQRAGLDALGVCRQPAALARLLKTSRNDESAMQTVAAEALAQQGFRAVDALQEDLKSPDRAVRARAVLALSRIRSTDSRVPLMQATEDRDEGIRALAEFLVRRLR